MSDRQPSLFGDDRPTLREILDGKVKPRDPSVTPSAAPRLSSQCQSILARLRQGPATNRELASIALKYSGRISDLRAAGYRIEAVSHDHKTGLVTYQLFE